MTRWTSFSRTQGPIACPSWVSCASPRCVRVRLCSYMSLEQSSRACDPEHRCVTLVKRGPKEACREATCGLPHGTGLAVCYEYVWPSEPGSHHLMIDPSSYDAMAMLCYLSSMCNVRDLTVESLWFPSLRSALEAIHHDALVLTRAA